MENIQSSKLARELEPLQARIDELNANRLTLEQALDQVEAGLEKLEGARPRYEALQEVCTALGKLDEQGAKDLFWNELPEDIQPDKILERLRRLPMHLQEKIAATLERKEALQAELKLCCDEMYYLDGQVHEAYLREQARREKFVIEREIAFFPMHVAVMPWSKETDSERYFRRAVLIALLLSFLVGGIVPLVNIPQPDRSMETIEIPERIAKLVKSASVIPEAPPVPQIAEEEPEKVDEEKPEEKESEPDEALAVEETARRKAQSSGVLAFKDTFKDLIVDAPAAQLGINVRSNNKAPRAAETSRSRRSLVAMQATGTSGGISASTVSRNIGYGEKNGSGKQIGGVAFSRVKSSVANLAEQEGRSLGSGPSPARTDEEIQIVFDRYKATLYRIYNKELRKNPTLRGNILLRISIEPGGEVSACSVESTDLESPELVKKIVARVVRFNFGPKKDVSKITILYPIDFLPAR